MALLVDIIFREEEAEVTDFGEGRIDRADRLFAAEFGTGVDERAGLRVAGSGVDGGKRRRLICAEALAASRGGRGCCALRAVNDAALQAGRFEVAGARIGQEAVANAVSSKIRPTPPPRKDGSTATFRISLSPGAVARVTRNPPTRPPTVATTQS